MTLALEAVTCAYGAARVVHDVSLTLSPGEILCLMGRNGAGKTTTLKAIMGLVKPASGRIRLDDQDLTGLRPHEIPPLGVAYVPQGRGVFPSLSVEENLRMGLLVRGSRRVIPEWIFELFPVLRGRLRQQAGTLSGGEQQMLATARALCAEPRYLLMDEPTEGLMPALVRSLLGVIQFLKTRGVGILLVEQKVDAALQVADRVVLMEAGRVRYHGTPADVAAVPEVLVRYLGVRRAAP
ncbi:MAG: ABC transporter ATP-binding protein [Armatimonadota bacterium]|nr:ABC transporter ATP-binding protein [Armatimonadota bacterium]